MHAHTRHSQSEAHTRARTPPPPPPPPQLRYRNNSNYKNDTEIRKRAFVSQAVLDELKRIIEDSEARLFLGAGWRGGEGTGPAGRCAGERMCTCVCAARAFWPRGLRRGAWRLVARGGPGGGRATLFSHARDPPPTACHTPAAQIMKEDDANWPPADRVG
jgi:hypothetical protein